VRFKCRLTEYRETTEYLAKCENLYALMLTLSIGDSYNESVNVDLLCAEKSLLQNYESKSKTL